MRHTRRQVEVEDEEEQLGPNYPKRIFYGVVALAAFIAFRAWMISEEDRGKEAGEVMRQTIELRHKMDAARDKAGQDAFNYAR